VAAPQEVDDGAVVAIVSDGKVGPVPVEISANHDLVIGDRVPHGHARRGAPVPLSRGRVRAVGEEIAVRSGYLGQVDLALEAFELVVLAADRTTAMRRHRWPPSVAIRRALPSLRLARARFSGSPSRISGRSGMIIPSRGVLGRHPGIPTRKGDDRQVRAPVIAAPRMPVRA
jgi:hypothetical protein